MTTLRSAMKSSISRPQTPRTTSSDSVITSVQDSSHSSLVSTPSPPHSHGPSPQPIHSPHIKDQPTHSILLSPHFELPPPLTLTSPNEGEYKIEVVGDESQPTPTNSTAEESAHTHISLPASSRPSTAKSMSSFASGSTPATSPRSTNHLHLPHHNHGPTSPGGYTPKVSFDTFENQAAPMFSFTLQVKSEGYKRGRSTRVYLCASSPDESGREALDWSLESLVQDGDELIVCRGVDEDVLDHDHDIVRDEARELMRQIQERSAEFDPDRKLSLILEYIPGKITDTLDRLIALYRPDSLVVGTRGKKGNALFGFVPGSSGSLGIGSVSKYCLSHSPVPVIVVRPERKVKKTMEKRRADPKRGKHFE